MVDLSTINGLDHRFRADSITGLADGGTVTSWPESVAGKNAAVNNSAATYKFYGASVAGKAAVRCANTTNTYLESSASSSLAATTTMAVVKVDSTGSGARTVLGPSIGNALQRTIGSNNFQQTVASSAALIGTATTVAPTDVAAVLTWVWDSTGGAWSFYVNGTLSGSGTLARTLAANGLTRIGHSNGGETFKGDIAEIAVFNKILSASERAQMHSYAQDYYGITVSDYVPSGPVVTNTTPVTISPTTGVVTGTVMSVTNGAWSATPDSYTYQWTRAGAAISGATSNTYTLVSADVGQAIRCVVTAVKSGYTSGTSTSNAVTPAAAGSTAPGAPTALAATAGDTQVSLTWTAPSSDGGAAINDYKVEYKTSAGSTWTTFARTASTTASQVVTGLTNNTAYDFRVSAINGIGTSSPSSTVSSTPIPASAIIPVTDPNLVFSPGNWDITSARAQAVNNGAYVRMTFMGSPTSIVANFDLSGTDNALNSTKIEIRVDSESVVVSDLAAAMTIPIPATNSWTKHFVEITIVQLIGNDLWTPTTTIKLTGFTVKPSTVTTITTRRRPFRVLCLGDSITNGAFTGATYGIDGRLGWAYPLRAYLGAEVGVVGFNSQGFSTVGSGGVPVFGTTFDKVFNGAPRSFAGLDAVIINHGANDGGTDNTTAMTTVLNALLAANSTMKIIILQNWSGNAQKTYWTNAIAACTAPSRVTYIDTTGWYSNAGADGGLHPLGYINLGDLSPRTAAAVLPVLAGTPAYRRWLNRGGTAVGIG